MLANPSLLAVAEALQDRAVTAFVRRVVTAGYAEYFRPPAEPAGELVQAAFDRLAESQAAGLDAERLAGTTAALIADTFRKGDDGFWFNRTYHHYKTQLKPETDFQQLRGLIRGARVLDYGCGSGYLAARLARGGYRLFTTDVLDYRYAEARHLPFVQMASPADVRYPDDSIDTALVQAVLHHIDPGDLGPVLERLARVARRVLIKEDSYGLPADLPGLAETLAAQPLLRAFVALPEVAQVRALVLIDYFANAVAQGLLQMNMPFAFRSVTSWQQALAAHGLRATRTLVAGFEPGRMHQSCHVWFVCERSA